MDGCESAHSGEHFPALDFLHLSLLDHASDGALDQSLAVLGGLQLVEQPGGGHLVADAHLLPHQFLDLLDVFSDAVGKFVAELAAALHCLHR